MSKKVEIAVSYPEQRENGWHFRAVFGPFETKEEADKFASYVGFFEPNDEAPPALGINVSETIVTKDKFGG